MEHYPDCIEMLKELKDCETIIKMYKARVASSPYDVDAHLGLTMVYIDAKLYDKAARQLLNIFEIENQIRDQHQLDVNLPLDEIISIFSGSDGEKLLGSLEKVANEYSEPAQKRCKETIKQSRANKTDV